MSASPPIMHRTYYIPCALPSPKFQSQDNSSSLARTHLKSMNEGIDTSTVPSWLPLLPAAADAAGGHIPLAARLNKPRSAVLALVLVGSSMKNGESCAPNTSETSASASPA